MMAITRNWLYFGKEWHLVECEDSKPTISVDVAKDDDSLTDPDVIHATMTSTFTDKARIWWVLTQSYGRAVVYAVLAGWARRQNRDN